MRDGTAKQATIIITSVLLGLWLALCAYFFLVRTDELSVDEQRFEQVVQGMEAVHLPVLGTLNDYGYGGFYWLVNRAAYGAFGILGWRAMALAFFAIWPVSGLLLYLRRGSIAAAFPTLMFLTAPACLFFGKIIGPETMIIGLAALGTLLIARGRLSLGSLLFGLVIGIKPNALTIALLPALHILSTKQQRPMRSLISAGGMLVAGLVLANPALLAGHWRDLLANYPINSLAFSTSNLLKTLSLEYWEWDLVFSGGFFQFAFNAVATWMLFITGLLLNKRAALVSLGIFAATVAFFSINYRFLGWYWLPILPLLFYPYVVDGPPPNQRQAVGMAAAIAANILLSGPQMVMLIRIRSMQASLGYSVLPIVKATTEAILATGSSNVTVCNSFDYGATEYYYQELQKLTDRGVALTMLTHDQCWINFHHGTREFFAGLHYPLVWVIGPRVNILAARYLLPVLAEAIHVDAGEHGRVVTLTKPPSAYPDLPI